MDHTNHHIEYVRIGDVIRATPPHALLRVELVEQDAADCQVMFDGETPIVFRVRKPHDCSLAQEACDLVSAIYWSRARVIEGSTPGRYTIQGGP